MLEVDRTLSSTLLLEVKRNKESDKRNAISFYRDFNLKRHYNDIYIYVES